MPKVESRKAADYDAALLGEMMNQKLELLMPAGSLSKLSLALDYGADAVYFGPPLYSLRARDNDFDLQQISEAIDDVHSRGKMAYLTLNIFARNRKLRPFAQDILEYAKLKPDALIMSDPGLISIVRENAPQIPVHLSVQANCMNWESVRFWQKSLGVTRIILSRELSVNEISEIKQKVPDIELEAFVHGSICIAYSGRCLLSSYMNRRDANQGVCDNSCREKYQVQDLNIGIQDLRDPEAGVYPLLEDEHGTYIMNAKDLCMIEHLGELAKAGVVSFKVEGRTKSEFYAAIVAKAYRQALDDVMQGRPVNPRWRELLNMLTHRGYHTAFMFQDPGSAGQNYQTTSEKNPNIQILGIVKELGSSHQVKLAVKNRLQTGDTVEILSPRGENQKARIARIQSDQRCEAQVVHSGAGEFWIEFANEVQCSRNSILVSHGKQAAQ